MLIRSIQSAFHYQPYTMPRLAITSHSPRVHLAFASRRVAARCLVLPHVAACCLASRRVASPCVAYSSVASRRVASPRLASPRVASRRVALPRLASPRLALLRHFPRCLPCSQRVSTSVRHRPTVIRDTPYRPLAPSSLEPDSLSGYVCMTAIAHTRGNPDPRGGPTRTG